MPPLWTLRAGVKHFSWGLINVGTDISSLFPGMCLPVFAETMNIFNSLAPFSMCQWQAVDGVRAGSSTRWVGAFSGKHRKRVRTQGYNSSLRLWRYAALLRVLSQALPASDGSSFYSSPSGPLKHSSQKIKDTRCLVSQKKSSELYSGLFAHKSTHSSSVQHLEQGKMLRKKKLSAYEKLT